MDEKIEQLANLFAETGQAHHAAFIETDGADPDWPMWYADYLYDKLPEYLRTTLTRSEIIYHLLHLSYRQATDARDMQWTVYYAKSLLECFG
jgi:NAD(P)H-hydrate epimerase